MGELASTVAARARRRALERKSTPRELAALGLAGIVESHMQHEKYLQPGSGDLDSTGFLQQRGSQGWGTSESIEKDTDDFLDRARAINRKGFRGSAGDLAQAVQRSAYGERYDAPDVRRQAREYGFFGGGATGGGGGGTVEVGGRSPADLSGGGTGLADMLRASMEQQQAPAVGASMPQLPDFAAAPVMAGQTPGGTWAPQQQTSQLDQQLDMAASLRGADPAPARQGVDVELGGGGSSSAGAPAAGGGGITPGGGYKGTKGVASGLADIGFDLGLKAISEKRDNTNPFSGSRSDHDNGNKDAYAYDLSNGSAPTPEMDRAALRIMRQLGFKDYKMGQPIDTSQGVKEFSTEHGKFRVQVIYRGSGEAYGGNHLNHVHVGVKRIG